MPRRRPCFSEAHVLAILLLAVASCSKQAGADDIATVAPSGSEGLPLSAEPPAALATNSEERGAEAGRENGFSFGLDVGERGYSGALSPLLGSSFLIDTYFGWQFDRWAFGIDLHGGGMGSAPPLPDNGTGFNSPFGLGPFAERIWGDGRLRAWTRMGASFEAIEHQIDGNPSNTNGASNGFALNLKAGGRLRIGGPLWITAGAGLSQSWYQSFAGATKPQGVSLEASAGLAFFFSQNHSVGSTEEHIESDSKPSRVVQLLDSWIDGSVVHFWLGDGPAEINADQTYLGNRFSAGVDLYLGRNVQWLVGWHLFMLQSGESTYELGPIHRFFSFGPELGIFVLPNLLYAKLTGGFQPLVSGGNGPNSSAIAAQLFYGCAVGARINFAHQKNLGLEYAFHYSPRTSDGWEGIGRYDPSGAPLFRDSFFPAEFVYSLSLVFGLDHDFRAHDASSN